MKYILINTKRGRWCHLMGGGYKMFHCVPAPSGIFTNCDPLDNQERLALWKEKKKRYDEAQQSGGMT